jgi:hypothetical protein
LAFFDEPVWQLEDCIRGLATVADRVVVVDGRYARYEAPYDNSPQEQIDVIRQVAEDVGLDCDIYVPDDGPWAGQVEKRNFLMNHAAQDCDWFMAVDADHIWTGPRDTIRAELQRTPTHVDGLIVRMFTPSNPDRPIEKSAAGKWHSDHADRWLSPQRIFRSLPDVRVERFHWWYSAEKAGRRIWLWGGDRTRPHALMRDMRSPMVVEHRCLFREPLQIERNRVFCADRIAIVDETGQEDDVKAEAVA